MGSSTKSDFLKMRPIPKKLYMYGIQWTGCSSGNALKSKFILQLNVFRIIQTLSSGDPVTVEVFILVDRPLTDLGVAGGAAGELLLLPCTPVLRPRWNLPQVRSVNRRWMCWSRESRPCCSPRQPHPRHRYSQELLLGTGDTPQLRARLDLSEVKKTNRIFWYTKACPDSP